MMPQDDFTTTFKDIQDLRNHAELVIESIKDAISEPFPTKKAPSFTSQHLSEITGLKKSRINYLMNTRPELPSGQLEGAGKAKKFTLEEVMQWVEYAVEEKMAEIAKFKDKKLPEDLQNFTVREPSQPGKFIITAVFKGGVSKSTTSVGLAQGLTLKGMKVLFLDLDPQATGTALCGIDPSTIGVEETLVPLLDAGVEYKFDIKEAGLIRQSYWKNIDIIPAATSLYSAELIIPSHLVKSRSQAELASMPVTHKRSDGNYTYPFWEILRYQLRDISYEYDAIVIDTAPSLSYLSMTALMIADGILVPVPPASLDFASSVQFWSLISDLADTFDAQREKVFDFVNVIKVKTKNDNLYPIVSRWISHAYGKYLLNIELPESKAVSNASTEFSTIYDKPTPEGSVDSHRRYKAPFDELVTYVESRIRSSWKRDQIKDQMSKTPTKEVA